MRVDQAPGLGSELDCWLDCTGVDSFPSQTFAEVSRNPAEGAPMKWVGIIVTASGAGARRDVGPWSAR